MEPTQAQIREFWEWCGLTLRDEVGYHGWYRGIGVTGWEWVASELTIDLNSLFKYACLKLIAEMWFPTVSWATYEGDREGITEGDGWFADLNYYGIDREERLERYGQPVWFGSGHDTDPAIALFQAIQEMRCSYHTR